jgi:hypothetical protein
LDGDLVDLHLEVVNFWSHIRNVFLVDIDLDLMLVFSPFLFIKKKGVLGFDVGDFIIEPEEIVFKILEFEEFLFEWGDDGVLVRRLNLIEMVVGLKISLHEWFSIWIKKKMNL